MSDSNKPKMSFEQLQAMLADMGADDKQTAKIAKTLNIETPKTVAERFTVVDTDAGKRLVMRNPGVKGKPRTIVPSDLGNDLANARRIVADLEAAAEYLATHAENL